MVTKDLKSTKGITLISLVVSIVVMLILAGVSIVTLTGDNGLLNQVQNARKATTLATMEEELNLVYMSIYTEKTQTGAINSSVSLDEIYEYDKLSSETKNHIIQLGGVSSISFVNPNQSTNIALLTEDNAITKAGTVGTNTVSIQVKEESDSNSYWLESDGIYYPMSISNSYVTLDKENISTEEPKGEGELGSGIEVKFIDSGATESASSSSYIEKNVSKEGAVTTITLTAAEAGSTKVIVRNGEIALTEGNINVIVSPVYEINIGQMEHGSIVKTTGGHDTTNHTKYENEAVVQLNAIGATTPKKYEFEKWNDDNSTTNSKEITVSSATPNVTYTATFVESLKYGKNSNIGTITVSESSLTAGWKFFYEEEATNGNIYLIYGDYLPNGAIPTGTNITKSGYSVCTSSLSSNRNDLVEYLLGTGDYTNTWGKINDAAKTAIKAKLIANGTTEEEAEDTVTRITTVGAPTPEQWMSSYNENYGTRLKAKNCTTTKQTYYKTNSDGSINTKSTYTTSYTGYLYTRNNTTNTIMWEINFPTKYMRTLSGYPGSENSNMYYAHTSGVVEGTTTTGGYWLARLCCCWISSSVQCKIRWGDGIWTEG